MNKLSLLLPALLLAACSPKSSSSNESVTGSGIIGGQIAAINSPDIKPVVMIYAESSGGLCTGTLVADDTILTAAHCVTQEPAEGQTGLKSEDPQHMFILFGVTPLSGSNRVIRRVVSMVAHPKYGKTTGDADVYDIALIRFSGGRPPGTEIAMLPDGPPTDVIVPFIAAGYGRANGFLNKKTTPENPTGSGTLRLTNLKALFLFDHDREFVVDQTQGNGICLGDSGGPALVKRADGKYTVIGVVSRVMAAGTTDTDAKETEFNMCEHSSIYTSVSGFTGWVRSAIIQLHPM